MIKHKKMLIILINLILLMFLISSTVFGTLIDEFHNSIDTSGSDDLKTEGGQIIGIIQVIGTIVSIAMLSVIGIKYMLGSADQKAEYRKSMLPYFIGAILIFGFSNITQIIYKWASNI